jgi:hypothetical protein
MVICNGYKNQEEEKETVAYFVKAVFALIFVFYINV